MNIYYILNPEQSGFEIWHVPYFIAFALIVCLGFAALSFDHARRGNVHDLPTWWILVAGIGMLAGFTPWGIGFFLVLCSMIAGMNMGVGIITLGFGVFMWCLFIRSWMPNEWFRKRPTT